MLRQRARHRQFVLTEPDSESAEAGVLPVRQPAALFQMMNDLAPVAF